MTQLLTVVRRLVRLAALRQLAPTHVVIADAFAEAWRDAPTRAPHLNPSRLEAVVVDHATARVAALLDAFRDATAANDCAHADALGDVCAEGVEHIVARDRASAEDFDAYLVRESAAIGCTPDVLCRALALPVEVA